jgi:hypothetical protein
MRIVSDNDQKAREDSGRVIKFQNGGWAGKYIPLPNLWLDATILRNLMIKIKRPPALYGPRKTKEPLMNADIY